MTLHDALKKSPFGYARKIHNGAELFHSEGRQYINTNGHLIPTVKLVELSASDWEPITENGH